MLDGVRRNLRHHGVLAAAHWALGGLAYELVREGIRRRSAPSVGELAELNGSVGTSPETLLRQMAPDVDEGTLDELRHEHAEVERDLQARYAGCDLDYPENYAVEGATSFLLYAAARLLRPRAVLETGVANGHSTFILLSALRRNGEGTLFSYDVGADVGVLVDPGLRERWALTVGDDKRPEDGLRSLLARTGPIDLAFLDADHSYHGQLFEYRSALTALTAAGVLISDDVDYSRAFVDILGSAGSRRPSLLFDARKVVGVLLPQGSGVSPRSSSEVVGAR